MANIYRKKYSQPLPHGARIVKRDGEWFAQWVDRYGKDREAPLTPKRNRIVCWTKSWIAQYRDGQGNVRNVSTDCTDEQSARYVLAELVKRAEHIRAGIMTPQQSRVADASSVPLRDHVQAYCQHLKVKTVRGRRVSVKHRKEVLREIERIVRERGFSRLGDITREEMEKWMLKAEGEGMGARTRNTYRAAIMTFCNWCVATDRLLANPLKGLTSAEDRFDRRRRRRALTEDEIRRLLHAARHRPLAEYGRGTVRLPPEQRVGRSTWRKPLLTPDTMDEAVERAREVLRDNPELVVASERLGQERALTYKLMVLTGLRKGEVASLTVGDLYLDSAQPHVEILPEHEKSGRGAKLPLRTDLVEDLREWLALKLQMLREAAEGNGTPIPLRLPLDEHVFEIPTGMIRIFGRDLEAAGIPKQDERGRTVDVHALRHTFGTHLSLNGVAPRVAQAAMRHSKIELTMNVYTDPELLDVAGAVAALPSLSLADTRGPEAGRKSAT